MARIIAIIVAAGRGSRAGAGGPKQYRLLAGEPIIARTAKAFLDHPSIDHVRVIIHRDDEEAYAEAMQSLQSHRAMLPPVHGGAERQDSVRLGLESLELDGHAAPEDCVLIHDAARPFIDEETISRVITSLETHQGAIAALPVFDTIKRAHPSAITNTTTDHPLIDTTVPRDALWRAQTPQGFHFGMILDAHRAAAGRVLTDDAAVAEIANVAVALVPGAPDNMKITQAEDFGMAETILNRWRENK